MISYFHKILIMINTTIFGANEQRTKHIIYKANLKFHLGNQQWTCCINIVNVAQEISERKDKQADPHNSG